MKKAAEHCPIKGKEKIQLDSVNFEKMIAGLKKSENTGRVEKIDNDTYVVSRVILQ